MAKEQDWRRLYWHTETDNVAARALYDRIARVTNYVRYDIALRMISAWGRAKRCPSRASWFLADV